MGKKFFEKRIIKGMIPFVFVIVLISAVFQSCQKDDILQSVNPETETIQANQLKSATITTDDIVGLIRKIIHYLEVGDLESDLANAFIVKLENAKKSLEKGNEKASTNQLQALMNQVKGLKEAGAIEASIGEGIIFDLKVMAGENPTFTDPRDGKVYKTIKIGDQVWMAENLAYKTADSYAYNDSEDSAAIYGRLYNWYELNQAVPDGWHLPSKAEWEQLSDFLKENGYSYDDNDDTKIAKALAATTSWLTCDVDGTPGNDILSNNSSGFSGLPGGYRNGQFSSFTMINKTGFWWSSSGTSDSQPIIARLYYNNSAFVIWQAPNGYSYSVRCVRD